MTSSNSQNSSVMVGQFTCSDSRLQAFGNTICITPTLPKCGGRWKSYGDCIPIIESISTQPMMLNGNNTVGTFRLLTKPHNKSLDASGGSVFRIMTGPVMLE